MISVLGRTTSRAVAVGSESSGSGDEDSKSFLVRFAMLGTAERGVYNLVEKLLCSHL